MLEYDDPNTRQMIPLSHAYAAVWARILDYPKEVGGGHPGKREWFPTSRTPRNTRYYTSHVSATSSTTKLYTDHSMFSMFFMPPPPGIPGGEVQVSCSMFGEPFDEELLEQLMMGVSHLPYSALVVRAIIERADFLDEQPMYRGIPGVALRHASPSEDRKGMYGALEPQATSPFLRPVQPREKSTDVQNVPRGTDKAKN